jgi:hypothetical protein
MRRPLLAWLGDVFCALAAYTLSRWIWEKHTESVFENLLPELGTFASLYILLKLSLKGIGLARRRKKGVASA